MYFGPNHSPPCDEDCSNCDNTRCLDHPRHKDAERREREYPPKACAYCGQPFTPTSPGQRYCSREDNPECDTLRFLDSLTPLQYIRFHGYRSKKEFIAEQGNDAWLALQKK